jgi:hypothetical protein
VDSLQERVAEPIPSVNGQNGHGPKLSPDEMRNMAARFTR